MNTLTQLQSALSNKHEDAKLSLLGLLAGIKDNDTAFNVVNFAKSFKRNASIDNFISAVNVELGIQARVDYLGIFSGCSNWRTVADLLDLIKCHEEQERGGF